MYIKLSLAFALVIALFSQCGSPTTIDPVAAHIDSSIVPGDNFFMYANNKWFAQNPIPASESSAGIWKIIGDTINAQIQKICTDAMQANAAEGSHKQKIGDFYYSGMDTVSIEKNGIAPLQQYLQQIDAITQKAEIPTLMANLAKIGVGTGFGMAIGKDDKKSTEYALWLWQGGLGLPERDYYFATDSRTGIIRSAYQNYIAQLFDLANISDAKIKAAQILQLETSLAKASRKMEALRDPQNNYHKIAFTKLKTDANQYDWHSYVSSMGLQNIDSVIVGQPEFVNGFNTAFQQYSVAQWKAYLQFHVLATFAPYLSSTFEKADFDFNQGVMQGVKAQKPRWKRVVENTNDMLGELIGQVYVNDCLPKGTKEKLVEIGNTIKAVYVEHIKVLDWMSDATKQKALFKLDKITMKMGYPDKWKDLSALKITKHSYVANIIASNEWDYKDEISKYGKPVDKTEWNMTPQTYNAYYDPTNNEIVIPACNIIVPGFDKTMPDDAVLYGIIGGSTIGHEITHGFDDQGSQYDADGNLNNWWTAEDKIKFTEKTKKIVQQFNNFIVLDSLHINGDATQGENIADLGGIVMGYEAFKKTNQYKNNVIIAGQTPDQRFLLSYAYAWMVNKRHEAIARQIKTDVHSPAEYRVNGPVVNMDIFYTAFAVSEKNKMYRQPDQRIKIW